VAWARCISRPVTTRRRIGRRHQGGAAGPDSDFILHRFRRERQIWLACIIRTSHGCSTGAPPTTAAHARDGVNRRLLDHDLRRATQPHHRGATSAVPAGVRPSSTRTATSSSIGISSRATS
jgi:hypothetical protein